jgi:hypothetical protein
MKLNRLTAIAFVLATSACAAVEGDKQVISVTTVPVAGASCTLSNKRGEWTLVTPADVSVKKSTSILKAACKKDGWKPATAYVASNPSAGAIIGTVLLFGVVESAVDGSTGAGNDYPKTLEIHLKPVVGELPAVSASAGMTPSVTISSSSTHTD